MTSREMENSAVGRLVVCDVALGCAGREVEIPSEDNEKRKYEK